MNNTDADHAWRAVGDDHPAPAGINPGVASPARMYDYYLGGKDNFAADRAAAEKALSVVPHGRSVARANRWFLIRAVDYCARQGITQYVDLGTGIPTSPNVHETARVLIPDTRVLYVDNDPVVTTHNRALLADKQDGVVAAEGDIRDPEGILASPELRQLIDFRQPVAVLLVAVLHFIRDQEDPAGIVRTFIDHMAPGSFLVLSHITSTGTRPEVVATIEEAYRGASAPAVFRTEDQIRAWFGGLELVEPGLVDTADWRNHHGIRLAEPPALRILAGIGRKQ